MGCLKTYVIQFAEMEDISMSIFMSFPAWQINQKTIEAQTSLRIQVLRMKNESVRR